MSTVNAASLVRYVFDDRPQTGATMRVANGVAWLRMPLPFSLSHINLWLLEDGDSWTVVDTGVHLEASEQVWQQTVDTVLGGKPISRVIATHLHPDHAGCAGWLCARFDATLWMARDEYRLFRLLTDHTQSSSDDAGDAFYTAAGFSTDALQHHRQVLGMFNKLVSPLPDDYVRLQDGDLVDIGGHQWQVIVGRGHSPEHACLYCADQNLLISGDQLLPTISSNVSVYPNEPTANPLHDWLSSLQYLKAKVPHDVNVLPAHGRPFRGAHERLDQLIAGHLEGLDKLELLCDEPRRAIDVFNALFRRDINHGNLVMATGEAVAHLNYLVSEQRVTSWRDEIGVNW
jgi:glyoxylase-like metal-dependent hydrolase (beta-lactamase superfamily II)